MEEILLKKLKNLQRDEINVLFSPFPSKKEINPQSWDKKLYFWTEVLLEASRRGLLRNSAFLIDKEITCSSKTFSYKGEKLAFEKRFFIESFLNGTLVNLQTNVISKFLSKIFGYKLPLFEKVLVKPLVDECCDLVLRILQDRKIMSFNHLIREINYIRDNQGHVPLSHDDSDFLLNYLLTHKKINLETKYDNVFISRERISDSDIDMYKLDQCIFTLKNLLNSIEGPSKVISFHQSISDKKMNKRLDDRKLELNSQIKNIENIRDSLLRSTTNQQIIENSRTIKEIISKTESIATPNQNRDHIGNDLDKPFVESKRESSLISQIKNLNAPRSSIKHESVKDDMSQLLADQ